MFSQASYRGTLCPTVACPLLELPLGQEGPQAVCMGW